MYIGSEERAPACPSGKIRNSKIKNSRGYMPHLNVLDTHGTYVSTFVAEHAAPSDDHDAMHSSK